jgi:hypothetical protein
VVGYPYSAKRTTGGLGAGPQKTPPIGLLVGAATICMTFQGSQGEVGEQSVSIGWLKPRVRLEMQVGDVWQAGPGATRHAGWGTRSGCLCMDKCREDILLYMEIYLL